MWPFKKKPAVQYVDPEELNYSQLDYTEYFFQNESLSKDEWVETAPINSTDQRVANLPPINTSEDEVFRVASELSDIRESFQIADDGVYCPICHIANVDIARLRQPCPKCGRPLLAFGWT